MNDLEKILFPAIKEILSKYCKNIVLQFRDKPSLLKEGEFISFGQTLIIGKKLEIEDVITAIYCASLNMADRLYNFSKDNIYILEDSFVMEAGYNKERDVTKVTIVGKIKI